MGGKAAGGEAYCTFRFARTGAAWGHAGTMTISFTESGATQDALELAEQLFEVAVGDLNDVLRAIRDGRYEAAREGKRAVRDLADLSRMVLEERRNVEKLRKQIAGAVGAGTGLDLDAARDEVGRRLALLRNARGD